MNNHQALILKCEELIKKYAEKSGVEHKGIKVNICLVGNEITGDKSLYRYHGYVEFHDNLSNREISIYPESEFRAMKILSDSDYYPDEWELENTIARAIFNIYLAEKFTQKYNNVICCDSTSFAIASLFVDLVAGSDKKVSKVTVKKVKKSRNKAA